MEIGRIIRAKRNLLGLTLEEISIETNIPKSKLSRIENGKQLMSVDVFFKLSTVLKFDINFNLN